MDEEKLNNSTMSAFELNTSYTTGISEGPSRLKSQMSMMSNVDLKEGKEKLYQFNFVYKLILTV
jgi:hypothetical protein